jgi:leucyl-tRNA synthetase
VAINGKTRTNLELPLTITASEVEALVKADPVVVKWLEGKDPKKVIYVPGKMINVVI